VISMLAWVVSEARKQISNAVKSLPPYLQIPSGTVISCAMDAVQNSQIVLSDLRRSGGP
jgi:hypothetical protein